MIFKTKAQVVALPFFSRLRKHYDVMSPSLALNFGSKEKRILVYSKAIALIVFCCGRAKANPPS